MTTAAMASGWGTRGRRWPRDQAHPGLRQNIVGYYDARNRVTSADERVSDWAEWRQRNPSIAQATATNQPIYGPDTGANYLANFQQNNNSASSPDAAPLQITGDITLEWYGSLIDWTPSAVQGLTGKWGDGTSRSYAINIAADGKPHFIITTAGTYQAANDIAASAAPTVADNAFLGIRAKWTAATKAIIFETSSDLGKTWTQLGTTQATADGSIFNGTATLTIGALGATTQPQYGKTLWSKVYNDATATNAVFYANFRGVPEGVTSFTESSSNAATVTINTSGTIPAQIVAAGQPSLLFAGSYWLQAVFTRNQPHSLIMVLKPNVWTTGRYYADGSTQNKATFEQGGTTPGTVMYAGATLSEVGGNLTIGTYRIASLVYADTGSIQINNNAATTGDVGALNAGGLTVGTSGDGSLGAAFQAKALAVFSSALSATDGRRCVRWFGSRRAFKMRNIL